MAACKVKPSGKSAFFVACYHGHLDLVNLSETVGLEVAEYRELENGLVEAIAVLISKMPRLRLESAVGNLGDCFKSKPNFIKSWEKWRSQITTLDCSPFWIQWDNQQTREGLRNLIQVMLGNTESLCTASCYWIELYASHFLYIRPFTTRIKSLYNLAQKCIQLKPPTGTHRLTGLMIGILAENTEFVLAEISREFGPWMVAHAVELLTAGSEQAEILLHDESYNLGGISMMELHRLAYAQVLSSHALTWQIAIIYLTSCVKQGMGLLENLLYRQSVQHNNLLLKNIEICRLYGLDHMSSNIMMVDEKKIDTHVGYCSHLLSAAKVHLEVAECEEQHICLETEMKWKIMLVKIACMIVPFKQWDPGVILEP